MNSNKEKQLLRRFLKEFDFMYDANVREKLLKCHSEYYAFLDREFTCWDNLRGGYARWFKYQILLAYIFYIESGKPYWIFNYLYDVLSYIVTTEDIALGEMDDEESKALRESFWYKKIYNELRTI